MNDFTAANLPFGVADAEGWDGPHIVVAIGSRAIDCEAARAAGCFDGTEAADVEFVAPDLNAFIAHGRSVVGVVRSRLAELLGHPSGAPPARLLCPLDELTMRCPISVADYVDFYSSEHHARHLGRILRPGEEPLAPNWKQIPVGYHGRSGSVVVGGTAVTRPCGVVGEGVYRPTAQLDIELEIGAVIGEPSVVGEPVPVDRADDHVVGLLLLNDWSARDIQAFEYRPLGPNLGKSFATSVSPWMVTLDALEPFRVEGPEQDPAPPAHLGSRGPAAYDVHVEAAITTEAMRSAGMPPLLIGRTNFSTTYWSIAQQVAHLTSNGAAVRTGDLLGSGTISGPGPGEAGSLIELTERGDQPITLPNGERRGFLEDGDEVTLRAWAGVGAQRVGFGEVTGVIAPARTREGVLR